MHTKFMSTLNDHQPPGAALNFLHHNAQSLLPKIEDYVSLPYVQSYHVLSVNETWLKPSLANSLVAIPNFRLLRSDRSHAATGKSRGGGAALYLKDELTYSEIPEFAASLRSCESIWVKVQVTGRRSIVVGSIYLPPDAPKGDFIHDLGELLESRSISQCDIMILGDLNINWNNASLAHRQQLSSLADQFALSQTVIGLTYVSPCTGNESLLDICLASKALGLIDSRCLVTDLSDHYALSVSIDVKPKRAPRVIRLSRNYTKCYPILVREPVNSALLDLINASKSPSAQTELLETWVISLLDQHAPERMCRVRPDSPRWLSAGLKRLISAKNRFYKKASRLEDPRAIAQYRKFRNHVHHELRKAKRMHYADVLSKDSRSFFSLANTMLGRGRKESPVPKEIVTSASVRLTEPGAMAEELNKFFTCLDSPTPSHVVSPRLGSAPRFSFRATNNEEVEQLLRQLDSSKKGGLNRIPAAVYQCLRPTIVPALRHIFNTCVEAASFPSMYKTALVTPLFKKGAPSDPGNYRPISSLPVMSKVLEKIINKQVTAFLAEHALLSEKQFGFRSRIGCEQMLLLITDIYHSVLDSKSPRYIAQLSLDVRKAFDTVNHAHLLQKLKNEYNFDLMAYGLVESYLSDRNQCMRVGTMISSPRAITKGVPQGSILGPLLFNLVVNQMLEEHNDTYSYADDTLLYACAPTQSQAVKQAADRFIVLQKWYLENGLELCVHKTRCLVLSNRAVDYEAAVMLGNTSLRVSEFVKVLGVTLDSKLNFREHIRCAVSKTASLMYPLRRIRKYLHYEDAKLIYLSIIRPHLEYCSSLFVRSTLAIANSLDSSQDRAVRIICNAPSIFSVTDGRRALDIHTLASRRLCYFSNLAYRTYYGHGSEALYNRLHEHGQNVDTRLRSGCSLVLPHAMTAHGLSRFVYQAIKVMKSSLKPDLTYIKTR